jgi:hypothetical protein
MLSHSRNRKSFYKDGMVPVQATAAVKKNKCKSVSRQVGLEKKINAWIWNFGDEAVSFIIITKNYKCIAYYYYYY